ncbi:MAG: acetoacetate--CoA ligase [Actinomycetia bacterium]|nr:acetoacetate--CoA ligase [Actinomycetes bacterium]
MTEQGRLLWQPTSERIADSQMAAFAAAHQPQGDQDTLYEWSLRNPDAFWEAVWAFGGVIGDRGTGPAVTDGEIRQTRFFPAARVSYAENLLAGGDRAGAGDVAIIYRREDGLRRELTWPTLRAAVSRLTRWFVEQGVGPGDHVAAWLPNIPQTVITMLAANSLGAVFTSTSPDFGVAGVLDRFSQVQPKVLVAADGYVYGGKHHERLPLIADVTAGLPTLQAVLVVGELQTSPDLATIPRSLDLTVAGFAEVAETQATDSRADSAPGRELATAAEAAMAPVRQPFSEPGFVLYSSGTTGAPKCIVHSAAGILLKQISEQQLHCDIRAGDTVFYYTTCGWMMWNWLVTNLAHGATIVLYDGSPFAPDAMVLWDLAAQEQVSFFGTSAKYIDASAKAGTDPAAVHRFPKLRTIASTGSPLNAEGYEYIYEHVKSDVHLASISGGTDICGCFVGGDPTKPVHAGEIQGPILGVPVDVWDEAGATTVDRPGVRGELVCKAAIPSMPLRFMADPDDARYNAAYFERFDGTWAQGDFASWTEHGGLVIHGRADATLNAGGVRIGTAEIYRQVEQLPDVQESLAIGQEWDDDTRIVLFVRLAPDMPLDETLVRQIRTRLRTQCSPRHVPARIVAVPDLPRTRSGKLAELAVADVVHGRTVRNTEALANPESLEFFQEIAALQV